MWKLQLVHWGAFFYALVLLSVSPNKQLVRQHYHVSNIHECYHQTQFNDKNIGLSQFVSS